VGLTYMVNGPGGPSRPRYVSRGLAMNDPKAAGSK